jgi:hypothetical protein
MKNHLFRMPAQLAQTEGVWPRVAVSSISLQPENRQPVYLPTGPFAEFRGLTHKHHTAMARELAREEPGSLHSTVDYHLGMVE